MAQLQRIYACFDTLSIELYQVNVRVGHIARQQATMGGFAPKASPPPPPLMASDFDSKDEDDDDATTSEDDDDRDASSSSTDEMST